MKHDVSTAGTTLIRPADRWQWLNLGELWRYRELLYFLAWRDVKVRYKQTVLGAAWAVLQPLLMMIVFSIFFGRMAHVDSGGWPYPLFAFAGLLPWTFFATAIANAGNSVVGSERLITKIYFPRLAVPLAAVGAAMVDFLVALGMLVVLMAYYHVPPTAGLFWLPVVMALLACAAIGVGTLLAALNVAYRDFRYVIPFLVQLWMFATPSVYMQEGSASDVRAEAQGSQEGSGFRVQGSASDADSNPKSKIQNPKLNALLRLNPLTGLVSAFRAAVLGGPMPWNGLAASAAGVAIALLIGCFYFRRVEDSFADII
ncbi:MAG TPA: ABC transporter permease [Pirellulales bacterium]|nr:ABC transporter permease [Pirellulales bacterium]